MFERAGNISSFSTNQCAILQTHISYLKRKVLDSLGTGRKHLRVHVNFSGRFSCLETNFFFLFIIQWILKSKPTHYSNYQGLTHTSEVDWLEFWELCNAGAELRFRPSVGCPALIIVIILIVDLCLCPSLCFPKGKPGKKKRYAIRNEIYE